jgi:hypothetical protein
VAGIVKTFYNVTLWSFALGMVILCFYAPWTPTPAASPYTHVLLGYAPVWSAKFAGVPGARVDWGGFTLIAGAVGFFSIVMGAAAYFFRGKRGPEKDLDE